MSRVEICCTGTRSAAHAKLVIVRLNKIRGQWSETHYDRTGAPGEFFYTTLAELVEDDGRYPLPCRRCPKRNTRVTPETLTKALDAVVGAGFDSLDLTHLPF